MANNLERYIQKCHMSGSFLLPSGKVAAEYYDLHKLMSDPKSLKLLRDVVAAVLSEFEFDSIGCVELCPVPLLGALLSGPLCNKRGFVVRRRPKGYGTNNRVEGLLSLGDRVVLIEDVTASGRSIKRAIGVVENHKCTVVNITAIVNRQEGCNKLLIGYDFRWLYTMRELEDERV